MVNSLNMDVNNSTDTNYISGKQTVTSQLNSLNTKNHDYDVRNPGPVLGQAHICDSVNRLMGSQWLFSIML